MESKGPRVFFVAQFTPQGFLTEAKIQAFSPSCLQQELLPDGCVRVEICLGSSIFGSGSG